MNSFEDLASATGRREVCGVVKISCRSGVALRGSESERDARDEPGGVMSEP